MTTVLFRLSGGTSTRIERDQSTLRQAALEWRNRFEQGTLQATHLPWRQEAQAVPRHLAAAPALASEDTRLTHDAAREKGLRRLIEKMNEIYAPRRAEVIRLAATGGFGESLPIDSIAALGVTTLTGVEGDHKEWCKALRTLVHAGLLACDNGEVAQQEVLRVLPLLEAEGLKAGTALVQWCKTEAATNPALQCTARKVAKRPRHHAQADIRSAVTKAIVRLEAGCLDVELVSRATLGEFLQRTLADKIPDILDLKGKSFCDQYLSRERKGGQGLEPAGIATRRSGREFNDKARAELERAWSAGGRYLAGEDVATPRTLLRAAI